MIDLYVVKFGDLYSRGEPSEDDDAFPLLLSLRQTKAFAMRRELAAAHARVWTERAAAAGLSKPRLVKLVPRK